MRRWIALVVAAMALAACGIPLDSAPATIEVDLGNAPDLDLPAGEELSAVSVFLVREGGLVPVVDQLVPPISAESVATYLVEGIDPSSIGAGLRTSIPIGTRVLSVERDDGVALVNLSRDFAAVGGEEELLAVAQVVLTLTGLDHVGAVAFALEGVATDVPLPDGALAGEPVTADDYRSLIGGERP